MSSAKTVSVNANLVRERVNAETGEKFVSVSVPPAYKGAEWGSFTLPKKNVRTDAKDKERKRLSFTGMEKVYVAFGMGEKKKYFGYKPQNLIARLTPKAKKAEAAA